MGLPRRTARDVFYREAPRDQEAIRTLRTSGLLLVPFLVLVTLVLHFAGQSGIAEASGCFTLGTITAIATTAVIARRREHLYTLNVGSGGVSGLDILTNRHQKVVWADISHIRLASEELIEPQASQTVALAAEPTANIAWQQIEPDVDSVGFPSLLVGVILEKQNGENVWFRVSEREAADAILRGLAWHQAEFPE